MSDRFGGLPPAPPPPQGWAEPQRGPRPRTVRNAVLLMLVQVAVSLVSLIVLFATRDQLKQQIRDNTPNATTSTVNAAIAVAVVVAIVLIVLYTLLAVQVDRGRNWARVVTWVLAGLGILSGLVGLGQPEPGFSRALRVIGLLVQIGIVVLLALAPSHPYFRARR